tara:strand:+ start:10065 stop:10700 length:636 start_codon:yes stop_codon:yes gene_type:complete
VYEALYHELANDHSSLWGRKGPRSGIVPVGWWNGVKWRLITTWFSAEKLQPAKKYDPATQEFGAWSRCKQYLVRRWLADLPVMPAAAALSTTTATSDVPFASISSMTKDLGAVGKLLSIATPVAIAELEPTAASKMQSSIPIERLRSLSPTRSEGAGSTGRPNSSAGNSGVMVEEKGPSEDERSGDEDSKRKAKERERKRKESLNVPFQTA